MNLFKQLLIVTILLSQFRLLASLKDMRDLVIDATEGQNLARSARIVARGYSGSGKILADAIRTRAFGILGEMEKEEATCAAKLEAAERRAATARPAAPSKDMVPKTDLDKLKRSFELLKTENAGLKAAAEEKDAELARLSAELDRLRKDLQAGLDSFKAESEEKSETIKKLLEEE